MIQKTESGDRMTGAKCIRALVIDDEPLAREMIREMLEGDPQAEIIGECGNGRAAVEAINATAPDLIFLDIQMPEMGGFEVLESLHEHKPMSSLLPPTISMQSVPLRYMLSTTCSNLTIRNVLQLRGS
jgi:CheY-like chemotaxis protein